MATPYEWIKSTWHLWKTSRPVEDITLPPQKDFKCEAEITTAYRVNGKLVATKEEVAKECLLKLAEDYENNLTLRRMHYISGFWNAHTAANFASKHIDEIKEILEQ